MKKNVILVGIAVALCSCNNDMYDNIKEMVDKEKVYPAGYEQAFVEEHVRSGDERIEIDLYPSRLSAAEMERILPKAKKTVVEYGTERLVIDSVCSWVNITNLTVPNTYRFKIYTEDEHHNASIPVDVTGKPFTEADKGRLALVLSYTANTTQAVVSWTTTPDLYTITGAEYSYTDPSSGVQRGNTQKSRIGFNDLPMGATTTVDFSFKLLPLGVIDTVLVADVIAVKTMTQADFNSYISSTTPYPSGSQHILSTAAACFINAADFDMGGEGYGFHKYTSHDGDRTYRTDPGGSSLGVYINSGYYGIAWNAPGEWLTYMLEVQDPGEYKIEILYTGNVNNTGTCTIDALNFFGNISFPAKSSFTDYQYQEIGTVNLNTGKHKFTYIVVDGNIAFMGLRFTKV